VHRRASTIVLVLLLALPLVVSPASAGPHELEIDFAANCRRVTVTAEDGTRVNLAQIWFDGRTSTDGGADVSLRPDAQVFEHTTDTSTWMSQVRAHGTGSGEPDVQADCRDDDGDGVVDRDDDGAGDACDEDDDDDGVADGDDNCPSDPNAGQTDGDGDGTGDACDGDRDGDGVADGDDNCVGAANEDQTDTDGDGLGDACDDLPNDQDDDGVEDDEDNCRSVYNPDQTDTDDGGDGDLCDPDDDQDRIPDGEDNCPTDPNEDQSDADGDGLGDACDADQDGDGVDDVDDNCPLTANGGQVDADGDGLGDACDVIVDGSSDGSGGDEGDETWRRLWGATRIQTAVDVSQDDFPVDGSATGVVLARGDDPSGFADALAGTPLAHRLGAPMLITFPDELHPDTEAELVRVLPTGGTVTILGGRVAVSTAIEDRIDSLGYEVERVAGPDRFATAVEIAHELGDPDTLLLATGRNFADALAAGAAAARIEGAVVLTESDARASATDAYLESRPGATLWAIGGPAARPYPEAAPIVGRDRVATAVAVAEEFFDGPTSVGVAVSERFPDALTGGAHVARRGGPMLLTPSTGVPDVLVAWLCANHESISETLLYGGEGVIPESVRLALVRRTAGSDC
jgi:hypothetical protein